jgi:hypothetical protein
MFTWLRLCLDNLLQIKKKAASYEAAFFLTHSFRQSIGIPE